MESQASRPPHVLNKRERKLLRRQEHTALEQHAKRKETTKRWVKRLLWCFIGAAVVFLIVKVIQSVPKTLPDDIISNNGLHWHAKLKIVIKGKEEAIPADIGLGAVHNPIHTHDPDNTIHMEFQGRVTKDDLKLGEFFKVWNKKFNTECISVSSGKFCNGTEGTVKMLVNGQENMEFEDYQMKDNDEIEIRYE